ncbi:hypothetical protein ZWY2020_016347 [Hordeum vulgare]|nr:hypothetical protein ZWY2020_016347 [Hordeum vulgare]
MAPISTLGMKRCAPSDQDEHPVGRCKGASSHQAHKITSKGKEVANPEDHGVHEANEQKRRRHLAIDINKVPHKEYNDLDNPHPFVAPTVGCRCSQLPHWLLSLVRKKQALENKILELAEQRLRWATEDLTEEMELKKIRLENEKMRVVNNRLLLQVKRKELELNIVRAKRI